MRFLSPFTEQEGAQTIEEEGSGCIGHQHQDEGLPKLYSEKSIEISIYSIFWRKRRSLTSLGKSTISKVLVKSVDKPIESITTRMEGAKMEYSNKRFSRKFSMNG